MCIRRFEEVGAKVVSITCDGPAANFSMFCSLGCDHMKGQNVTKFKRGENRIYIFIDPCHTIKLVRNAFGGKIDFNYLEELLKLQDREGLHMVTKLTKAHLMFDKQK